MKKILFVLLLLPLAAQAAGGHTALDRAPIDTRDVISIQRGARTFVNYCLNCHSAQYMRFNRLKALGLNDQEIIDNLMFSATKVGENIYHLEIPVGFARKIRVRAQAIQPPEAKLGPNNPVWPCAGGCVGCGGANRNCGLVTQVSNTLPGLLAGVFVIGRRRRRRKQPPPRA